MMTPVLHDSDEWRNLTRNFNELKVQYEALRKTVDRLNVIVLIGEGMDKPSLVAYAQMTHRDIESVKESVEGVNKTMDKLPGRIATWLTIITLLIGLFVYLAPALQHATGMPAAHTMDHPISEMHRPTDAGMPAHP